jgi:hypothetical protein
VQVIGAETGAHRNRKNGMSAGAATGFADAGIAVNMNKEQGTAEVIE